MKRPNLSPVTYLWVALALTFALSPLVFALADRKPMLDEYPHDVGGWVIALVVWLGIGLTATWYYRGSEKRKRQL